MIIHILYLVFGACAVGRMLSCRDQLCEREHRQSVQAEEGVEKGFLVPMHARLKVLLVLLPVVLAQYYCTTDTTDCTVR